MHENAKNFRQKLKANFPQLHLATLVAIRILHPDDAFSEMFELEASPEEDQSLQGNKNKRRKSF